MKKAITLIALLTVGMLSFGQGNAKLNYVVGSFSGDYSREQRENVIRELAKAHRANVIEQGAYEALPKEVRSKMHIDALITGKCAIKTEVEKEIQTDKNGNKREVPVYKTKMTTTLTFYDIASKNVLYAADFECKGTDEDRNTSISDAIGVGHTRGKQTFVIVQLLTLDEYLQDKFPMSGKIITVNDVKKNEAKNVTVNLGARDAIYRGQTFEIVAAKKNYGRLRVREINDDTLATCTVEKGGKEIMKALESGEDINIVSFVQAVNLNAIVSKELEAPRLKVTDASEAMKRNVAFGSISGNAPSALVNAVKDRLRDNRRVNAFQLGAANCPTLDNLDGIAYGYYTGTEKSSRLVKADENLLVFKDYTEYTTYVGWYLFIVDPKTGDIIYAGNEGSSATSDKSADDATQKAIENAANITSATYSTYPLIGTILTVDNGDPKKAKEVSIDLGSDYPVYTGLRFDVYSLDAAGGWEKIGRIEVKSIEDGGRSVCTVKKGGEEIHKALEEGLPIRITTFILKEFFDL